MLKGCEDRVKAIRESDSRLNGQQAMTLVYNKVKAHLSDITMANLRKKTQKARVIYKLFVNIGVGKIMRIKTYSADAFSRLTDTQINSITVVPFYSEPRYNKEHCTMNYQYKTDFNI